MDTKRDLALRAQTQEERAALAEAQVEKAERLVQEAGAIIERQHAEVEYMQEGMRDLQFALENRGWKLLYGGVDQREFDGLKLDTLKALADELRTFARRSPVPSAPWMTSATRRSCSARKGSRKLSGLRPRTAMSSSS
jgi:hypothetical protein